MRKLLCLYILTYLFLTSISYSNNHDLYDNLKKAIVDEFLKMKIINNKEANLILNYKRKKKDNIVGVKLLCLESDLSQIETDEIIGLEFENNENVKIYGFGNNDWIDIKGNYTLESENINMSIKYKGKQETAKISRRTLKMEDDNISCLIFNHKLELNKIIKDLYLFHNGKYPVELKL
mgnify:CR=1 FL=1